MATTLGSVRRWLLALTVVLAGIAAVPAVAGAATIDATFGPTLTGTAPFDATPGPGNDDDPLDEIVRTNDYVTYTWAISVNDGSSPNTTITQTLPEGMEWESPLPAFCLSGGTPPSSISADGRTIVCNLGDKDSSTGSADQYPVVARVNGDVAHETEMSSNFIVSSSDPGTPDASPAQPEVVEVSAAPRVNLIKSQPNPTEGLGYHNGVWGQFINYPVSLAVDAINGKGSKGNELLETPITFNDAFTLTPTGVGFELVGCGPNSGHISGIPNGNGGSYNSATFSGTPSCSQTAPGANISFTVPSDADLTGEHVPTNNSNGGTVAANRAYLATYYIRVFVPNQDIVDVGGTVNVSNTYGDLDAESISGQENVDPPEDNSQSLDLEATDPQPGTTSISKWFSPSGSTTQWGQNQHIYPETTFWGILRLSTGGHLPIAAGSVAICDMFDNTTYNLTLEGTVGPDPAQPAWVTGSAAGTGANAIVEYGTGGVRGHDPDGWGTGGSPPGARDDTCADGASPSGWTTNPASVPGGLEAITKVRVRFPNEIPAGTGNVSTLQMNFKSRNAGLGETAPLPTRTILANFAKISRNQDQATPTWSSNNYNPETIGGSIGRRLFLTRGDVRLDKDSDPAGQTIALSGDVISYRLKVTATGETLPDGIMHDVVVRDTLDQYQSYVAASASPAPTDVIDNGDGTTTLVWELGDRPVNEPIPDITYDARIALNTPNSRDVINRAIVSSPDDASADGVRSDQHQIRVTQKAGILIEKTTSTPWVEPRDQLEFQVNYVNNSVTALNGMESIDVLPWNGDARGSDFNGTVSLDSVTVHDGQDVYYTSRPPAEVSDNPRDPSNGPGGTTQWCAPADLGSVAGCPDAIGDSTAVRIVDTGVVPRFASYVYDIVLNTDGNHSGDVYGNRAGLATPDQAVLLSAYTPVVQDRVVASALGDYVWIDANRNGIQDAGEDPVGGVTVTLTGTDKHGEDVELTTTTGDDGLYLFPHLVSGQYEIRFTLPNGYEFTQRGAGGDPARDSDADPATGRTGPITIDSPIPLQADQEDLTWDAGIVPLPGRITIIKDARPNADVDFRFETTGGLSPAGFTLNDDGQGQEDRITFDDLEAGEYGVSEAEHDGWRFTGAECTGTAASTVNGAAASITIAPGEEAVCTFVNERIEPEPKPKPRLVLRKQADRKKVRPGRVVTYKIKFRNAVRGSVARNVLICDTTPLKTTVVGRGGGFFRNGKVCWRIKKLAFSRGFKSRSLKLKVDRGVRNGTRIVNTVSSGKKKAKATVRVKVPRRNTGGHRGGGVTG